MVTLRPFNTYGPRQSARAVIPTILSQLLQGEREVALGSVEPRRDFTYVADTVDGFLAAGIAPNVEGQTIQLGTGKSASISDVFSIANEVCGTKASITQEGQRIRPANSEVMILESDPSRARELLGWSATVSLEKGIRKTVRWMREHLDSFDARRYSNLTIHWWPSTPLASRRLLPEARSDYSTCFRRTHLPPDRLQMWGDRQLSTTSQNCPSSMSE